MARQRISTDTFEDITANGTDIVYQYDVQTLDREFTTVSLGGQVLKYHTDYTAVVNPAGGGTITFYTAPASGEVIRVARAVALGRSSNYLLGRTIRGADMEQQVTYLMQSVYDETYRAASALSARDRFITVQGATKLLDDRRVAAEAFVPEAEQVIGSTEMTEVNTFFGMYSSASQKLTDYEHQMEQRVKDHYRYIRLDGTAEMGVSQRDVVPVSTSTDIRMRWTSSNTLEGIIPKATMPATDLFADWFAQTGLVETKTWYWGDYANTGSAIQTITSPIPVPAFVAGRAGNGHEVLIGVNQVAPLKFGLAGVTDPALKYSTVLSKTKPANIRNILAASSTTSHIDTLYKRLVIQVSTMVNGKELVLHTAQTQRRNTPAGVYFHGLDMGVSFRYTSRAPSSLVLSDEFMNNRSIEIDEAYARVVYRQNPSAGHYYSLAYLDNFNVLGTLPNQFMYPAFPNTDLLIRIITW